MSVNEKLITIAENQQKVYTSGQYSLYKDSEQLPIPVSGTSIRIDDMASVPHKVTVGKRGKNLINVMPIASYNNATGFVQDEENNTFTLRGNEGNGQFLAAAGQLMLPYTNGATISEQGIKVKGGITYTISFDYLLLEQGKYNNGISLVVYAETLATIACSPNAIVQGVVGETVRGSMNIKPTEDCTIGLCFRINNNYVAISNIQVEEGATATSYTPYVENLEAVKVYKYGKNLLDISTIPILNPNPSDMKNVVVDVETGTFSFEITMTAYSNGLTINAYLPIGTYFLSGSVHTASGLKCGVYIRKPDGSVYLNYAGNGFPLHPMVVDTEGIWKFTFYRPYSAPVGDIVTYSNVQLEVGKTRTEYQPYKASVDVGETFDSTTDTITLMPDTSGVILDCQYCRDFDKGISEANAEGRKAEHSLCWDAFQRNGNRRDYSWAFWNWYADWFYPKYDIVVATDTSLGITSGTGTFRGFNSGGSADFDLSARLEECGVVLDTSRSEIFQYFMHSTNVKRVPTLDFSSCINSYMAVYYTKIQIIDKLIFSETTATNSNMFMYNTLLTTITEVEGVIAKSLNFQHSPLDVPTMNRIIACLKDYSSIGGTYTLTLKKDREAMLTEEEKAAATNKGWTLVWS